jgi:integrase
LADILRKDGMSLVLIKKVIDQALGSILAEALGSGFVSRNVVRERARSRKRKGPKVGKRRLEVGKDIPLPKEIMSILDHAGRQWKTLLQVIAFTGMRVGEIRALHWRNVDLNGGGRIHVRQNADDQNTILDHTKSDAGYRTIPLLPSTAQALREWKIASRDKEGLVFPTRNGKVLARATIANCGLIPAVQRARLVDKWQPEEGKKPPRSIDKHGRVPRYTKPHALRHFYASLCINRKEDGGFGFPPKVVQERMGHATLAMTMDRYGHLFPTADESEAMANADKLLGFDVTIAPKVVS